MLQNMNNHSPRFKDAAIFTAWIVGILLFGGLLWYLTQDFRENRMIRTVNAVLIQNNDSRRIVSVLPDGGAQSKRIFQKYQRFALIESTGTAVVVTMYNNSIPSVFAAFLNSNGKINDIVPLDNHSEQVMSRIEEKKLDVYKMYIEEHEQRIRSGE